MYKRAGAALVSVCLLLSLSFAASAQSDYPSSANIQGRGSSGYGEPGQPPVTRQLGVPQRPAAGRDLTAYPEGGNRESGARSNNYDSANPPPSKPGKAKVACDPNEEYPTGAFRRAGGRNNYNCKAVRPGS